MWTLFVVLRLPVTHFPACVEQVGEPVHPQALLPQPSVEALHMRVLRRLAGLDVPQFNLPLQRPRQEMTTRELRAVVAANRLWPAAPGDDLIEHPRHAPAGEARVHFQRQTLAREGIDYAQHPDVPPCPD